jgi:peroxiredoxin
VNPIIEKFNPQYLKKGDKVPEINIRSSNGTQKRLLFIERNTVTLIVLYGSKCQVCDKNIPFWNKIIKNQKIFDFEIYGVSLKKIEEDDLLKTEDIQFEIFNISGDKKYIELFKSTIVPQTILIRKGGVVVENWLGLLTDERLNEIYKLIPGKNSHLTTG